MKTTFSLLDEPWLPVQLAGGGVTRLGLLELFERSGEIVALAETAPPSLIAEYRLLLAITHRALSRAFGGWKDKDRRRWYRDGLPVAEIHEYLEHWRERFWLFHPENPFMQVAALATADETRDKRKPWTQIALASASGNTPVMFDHSLDDAPLEITPADALGTLLGFLQFTPGGLVKVVRGSDKAGALVNTAAVLPVGATLQQTLCLALHPAPTGGINDLPAWERDALTIAELSGNPVLATGPNDRYTRQSRAVLLLREASGNIRWLRFAAGFALGDDPNAPDPMASYRAGSNGLVRLSFTEGRSLWRDLPALVPDISGTAARPAAVLTHAMSLHDSFDGVYQPVLVAGLASDQAKLLRWRSERVALPAVLLADANKANRLRKLVAEAEALFSELRKIATGLLADTLPDPSSKDTRSRARALVENGPLSATFFAHAERSLHEVLLALGEGRGDIADACWSEALRTSVRQAWTAVQNGIGRSPLALRAIARHEPRVAALLNKFLPNPENPPAKEA